MSIFKIEGGHELSGEIEIQGAKNETLQVICAVLLSDEKIILENIPNIIDVNLLISILENIGVKVKQLKSDTYQFQADDLSIDYLNTSSFKEKIRKLRGSIMIIGPLLARFGKASIPKPGGDKIGRRRIDTHIESLIKLGAKFHYDTEHQIYKIEVDSLKGTDILLDEASVTGTANVIMAAVLAEGITTIYNAACEPYIQQLCKMLNSMGAKISGIASNFLVIEGVKKLQGTYHRVMPDMIEIGSWIGMAAMTKSEITIKNVFLDQLGQIPIVFEKLGITLEQKGDDIHIPKKVSYKIKSYIDDSILTISDAPWPGFSPDLLSIVLVVATQVEGIVLIHQKMFESRLFFVDRLIDMGAKIILCDPHRAMIIGINHKFRLRALNISSSDIRAGISLLIAALSAKGTSVIKNVEQIDRGYENIVERLQKIGAKIERI